MKPFLTAAWSDLIVASYAVPEEVLLPYLRPGLVPDRWQGSAYCSLVAFTFAQMRVLGWSVPYPSDLCDFPEFNLRLYVREGTRRGVVFVRELVPSPLVAYGAKLLYGEPYSVARMRHRITQVGDLRRVRHDFVHEGKPQMIAVSARGQAHTPADDTFEAWVKEQAWGFGRLPGGRPVTYRVSHPRWRTYPIEDCQVAIDFVSLYGNRWGFLQGRTPDSVVLAEGSAVSIDPYQLQKETP